MELNAQDVVDIISLQRNEALSALAIANATIKFLQREIAELTKKDGGNK